MKAHRNMRPSPRSLAASAVLACLPVGCGGAPATTPQVPPPHNGAILVIPQDRGFAELVRMPSGKKTVFSIYLLGTDRKTPISPAATGGNLNLSPPYGPGIVGLRPIADALVSDPVALPANSELQGDLSVMVGGSELKIPVSLR